MLLKRIWHDQRGVVVTTDLILIATILVLGTIVGLATLRNSVVQEFGDLATAIGSLNQGYSYTGNIYDPVGTTYAEVEGSSYTDEADFCDGTDVANQPPAGISVLVSPADEG